GLDVDRVRRALVGSDQEDRLRRSSRGRVQHRVDPLDVRRVRESLDDLVDLVPGGDGGGGGRSDHDHERSEYEALHEPTACVYVRHLSREILCSGPIPWRNRDGRGSAAGRLQGSREDYAPQGGGNSGSTARATGRSPAIDSRTMPVAVAANSAMYRS